MKKLVLVQAKVESELKAKVEEIFADIGIDTSTSIRMFLKKVAQLGRIPFVVGMETEGEEADDAIAHLGKRMKKSCATPENK